MHPIRRQVFACLFLLSIAVVTVGCQPSADPQTEKGIAGPSNETPLGQVELKIDFLSDRDPIVSTVDCGEGATVLSVMQSAKKSGELEFEFTGSGEAAFVKSIGGVQNQGGSGDNWVFRVNDELGNASCGVISVNPGDRVLWVFGKYP